MQSGHPKYCWKNGREESAAPHNPALHIIGDVIRVLHMPEDPDPIPAGSTGIVTRVTEGTFAQIDVRWNDSGRSLSLVPGVDQFEVIKRAEPQADAVRVPQEVLKGIQAVRDSGMFNMLDLPAVAGLARQMGFDEAADWLGDRGNRKAYAQGIFRGFASEEE